jgi:hypothetical protein
MATATLPGASMIEKRPVAALARVEWRWIPAKVEPVLQSMTPDQSDC